MSIGCRAGHRGRDLNRSGDAFGGKGGGGQALAHGGQCFHTGALGGLSGERELRTRRTPRGSRAVGRSMEPE